MPEPHLAVTWTLDDLDADTTLVSVNNRLAQELRAQVDRGHAAAGRRVWPTPDILPWSAWLTRQYDRLLDGGHTTLDLLDPAQERLIWQDVIEHDTTHAGLLRPSAAAESAQSGFRLVCDWRLERQPLALLGSDDTRAFLGWMRTFTAELARRQLLAPAQLLPLIDAAYAAGALQPPARLVLSGFDSLPPAQLALFDTLRDRGCDVIEHRPVPRDCVQRRVVAADAEAELRLAATWTRDALAARPALRIAVVSPRIAQRRRDLERVFGEVLAPRSYLPGGPAERPFNVSLGEPLAEYPLVADALLALGLMVDALPLAAVGQLLRSPFIGGHASEWEARAQFDAWLRELGQPRIGLGELCYRLARPGRDGGERCPDLAARASALARHVRTLPPHDSPNAWAGHLLNALVLLGWPGDRPLDSAEFQQRERLQKVFSEFAALGKVRQTMRAGEAFSRLRGLAAETLFQPESPPAAVQLLGPLEAAGLTFDALWLLDMDDQAWPPAPAPHPLLPAGLQRQLDMPHASAARELAFATELTVRLAAGAAEVVASHACADADREQRASPLVSDWPLLDAGAPPVGPPSPLREACGAAVIRRPLATDATPPDAARMRGGAALLGLQAQCPFRAVARFRLQAEPLAEPSHAPDGAMLGNALHALLQRVWQTLRDSAGLERHDDLALQTLIEPLAAATLSDLGRDRPDLFTPRLQALETTRLTRLVIDWLAVERTRGQSFEVVALEAPRVVLLGGLELHTRADRVDRLADGSLAVIDYKTGSQVRDDGWFDPRLSEPQLPLYCVGTDDTVTATLLARVRRDRTGCRFVGVSRSTDVAPGVTSPDERRPGTDWDALVATWRQGLLTLAAEVVAGRADPTPSRQACEYCRLDALCRVGEMTEDTDD